MAKQNKELIEKLNTVIIELTGIVEELSGSAAPAAAEEAKTLTVDIPSEEDIRALDKAGVHELCGTLSIDTDNKLAVLVETLVSLSKFAAGEELDADDAAKLAEGLGLAVSKKHKENLANITEYIKADSDGAATEETTTDEADGEAEDPPAKAVKPAGKKPAAKPAAAEEDAEPAATEETTEDEAPALSDKDKRKRLAAFNAVSEKQLATYEKLAALLVDDDEAPAEWGSPYIKGGEFFCCGLPLEDVKHNKKEAGKCQVTDKIFVQDAEGVLQPVEE